MVSKLQSVHESHEKTLSALGQGYREQITELEKQLQIIEAQVRLADLVQARMSMGRIATDHAGHQEFQRWKNRLDSDFIRLANSEATITKPREKLAKESELIPGLYLAEPGKLPTIDR